MEELLKKFPILEDEVSIHLSPLEGFLYIYNYKSHSKKIGAKDYISVAINDSAQDILVRFDGKKSLDLIIKELTDGEGNYRASIPLVTEFIKKITDFVGFEFIRFLDFPTEKKLDITGDRNVILPVHATLELTDKCNLRCNYCYKESDSRKNAFLKEPLILLRSLYEIGIRHIELSGGEPLLHPELPEILKFLGSKFNMVALLTNGFFINEELLDIISEYKDKFILQIGLDGSNSEIVDKITGTKGAFKK